MRIPLELKKNLRVQLQSYENELKHIDSTEELQFKWPIMPDTPNAYWYRDQADKDQRNKYKYPVMTIRF